MSDVLTFTTATGRLVLSRAELAALADEAGADRVRGLDGLGLLHVGIDADAAQADLERRGLDRSRADLLGSESAWVRQRLALLRLDRPGERAVLVLRHDEDRLVSHLLASGDDLACAVSPVTPGPPASAAPDPLGRFSVEDVEPDELAGRVWRCCGLTPPPAGEVDPVHRVPLPRPLALGLREAARASAEDTTARLVDAGLAAGAASSLVADVAAGALPLVRVVAWRRHDDRVTESTLSWMVGHDRLWLVADRAAAGRAEVASATATQASRALAATIEEVLR